jgi:hypothetical protein
MPNSYTSKLDPTEKSKPYELYNARGELEGYYWYYGNVLNLEFNITGELTVENDAIIFKLGNQTPTETTVGYVGQRAYNIIDLKSWTCQSFTNGVYTWLEDEEFTYPEFEGESIYLDAAEYLRGKEVKLSIYNFRREVIAEKYLKAAPTIIFCIDPKLSEKLVRGLYYCSLEIFGEDIKETLFDANDCKLLVK